MTLMYIILAFTGVMGAMLAKDELSKMDKPAAAPKVRAKKA